MKKTTARPCVTSNSKKHIAPWKKIVAGMVIAAIGAVGTSFAAEYTVNGTTTPTLDAAITAASTGNGGAQDKAPIFNYAIPTESKGNLTDNSNVWNFSGVTYDSISLNGAAGGTTLSTQTPGFAAMRILQFAGVGEVAVKGLTIENGNLNVTNGNAVGAGMNVAPGAYSLTLTDMFFNDNSSASTSVAQQGAFGGALNAYGTMTPGANAVLSNVNFDGNQAVQETSGNGTYSSAQGGGGRLAGYQNVIYNGGVIENNTASQTNGAYAHGGGFSLHWTADTASTATYDLSNLTVTGNTAGAEDGFGIARGGGIYVGAENDNGVRVDVQANFSDSVFTGNTANSANGQGAYGGGLALFTMNDAGISANLNNAAFVDNSAVAGTGEALGGAIYTQGDVTFTGNTLFQGNTANAARNALYLANGANATFDGGTHLDYDGVANDGAGGIVATNGAMVALFGDYTGLSNAAGDWRYDGAIRGENGSAVILGTVRNFDWDDSDVSTQTYISTLTNNGQVIHLTEDSTAEYFVADDETYVANQALVEGTTGSSALVKTGNGTLDLTQDYIVVPNGFRNHLTGGTEILGGTVVINSNLQLGSVWAADYADWQSNNSSVTLDGGALHWTTPYDADTRQQPIDRTFHIGEFGGTIIVDADQHLEISGDPNDTYSTALDGSGQFVKAGDGALEISGDAYDFAGNTIVAEGRLELTMDRADDLRYGNGDGNLLVAPDATISIGADTDVQKNAAVVRGTYEDFDGSYLGLNRGGVFTNANGFTVNGEIEATGIENGLYFGNDGYDGVTGSPTGLTLNGTISSDTLYVEGDFVGNAGSNSTSNVRAIFDDNASFGGTHAMGELLVRGDTTITGTVDVDTDARLAQDLTVTGTGSLEVGENLYVGRNANLSNDASVTADGDITVYNDVTLRNNAEMVGGADVKIYGNVDMRQSTNLEAGDDLIIGGDLAMGGTAIASGKNVSVDGDFSDMINNVVTATDTVYLLGNGAGLNGNADLHNRVRGTINAGDMHVENGLTVQGGQLMLGNKDDVNGKLMNGDLFVDGDTVIANNPNDNTITGYVQGRNFLTTGSLDTRLNTEMNLEGDAQSYGNADIYGAVNADRLTVGGLDVDDNVIVSNLTVGSHAAINVGGGGKAGSGDIVVTGDVTYVNKRNNLANPVIDDISSAVVTGNDMTVGGTFTDMVGATTDLAGTLAVGEDANINGNVNAKALEVAENLNITGGVDADGNSMEVNIEKHTVVNGDMTLLDGVDADGEPVGAILNGETLIVHGAYADDVYSDVTMSGQASLLSGAEVKGMLTANGVYVVGDLNVNGGSVGSISADKSMDNDIVVREGGLNLTNGPAPDEFPGQIYGKDLIVDGLFTSENNTLADFSGGVYLLADTGTNLIGGTFNGETLYAASDVDVLNGANVTVLDNAKFDMNLNVDGRMLIGNQLLVEGDYTSGDDARVYAGGGATFMGSADLGGRQHFDTIDARNGLNIQDGALTFVGGGNPYSGNISVQGGLTMGTGAADADVAGLAGKNMTVDSMDLAFNSVVALSGKTTVTGANGQASQIDGIYVGTDFEVLAGETDAPNVVNVGDTADLTLLKGEYIGQRDTEFNADGVDLGFEEIYLVDNASLEGGNLRGQQTGVDGDDNPVYGGLRAVQLDNESTLSGDQLHVSGTYADRAGSVVNLDGRATFDNTTMITSQDFNANGITAKESLVVAPGADVNARNGDGNSDIAGDLAIGTGASFTANDLRVDGEFSDTKTSFTDLYGKASFGADSTIAAQGDGGYPGFFSEGLETDAGVSLTIAEGAWVDTDAEGDLTDTTIGGNLTVSPNARLDAGNLSVAGQYADHLSSQIHADGKVEFAQDVTTIRSGDFIAGEFDNAVGKALFLGENADVTVRAGSTNDGAIHMNDGSTYRVIAEEGLTNNGVVVALGADQTIDANMNHNGLVVIGNPLDTSDPGKLTVTGNWASGRDSEAVYVVDKAGDIGQIEIGGVAAPAERRGTTAISFYPYAYCDNENVKRLGLNANRNDLIMVKADAESDDMAFSLKNGKLNAGKWGFTLDSYTDEDFRYWQLNSEINTMVPERSDLVLMNIVAFDLPKHLNVSGPWFRMKGGKLTDDMSSFRNMTFQGLQIGWDKQITAALGNGCWYTGIFLEGDWNYGRGKYMESDDKGSTAVGSMKASYRGNGTGLYVNRSFCSGWYVDMVGRINVYDSKVETTMNDRECRSGDDYKAKWTETLFSMAFEFGKKFDINRGRFTFTPYNRVIYTSAPSRDYLVGYSDNITGATQVLNGAVDAWTNQLGARLYWNSKGTNRILGNVYVGADWYKGFSGAFDGSMRDVASTRLQQIETGRRFHNLSFGTATAGVTIKPRHNVTIGTEVEGIFGDVSGWSLNVSGRYRY